MQRVGNRSGRDRAAAPPQSARGHQSVQAVESGAAGATCAPNRRGQAFVPSSPISSRASARYW